MGAQHTDALRAALFSSAVPPVDSRIDMAAFQVKKVVAVCFLEAAKMTLEHLATHRLEQSQRMGAGASDLTRLYGETRRLRDYLQRCVSAYQDQVDIDLSPTDQGLLVACCRRNIEWIDLRLKGEQLVSAEERQWLQKKLQVIADWAVELGEKPLIELPLPRQSAVVSEASRGVLSRLQNKLFGDVSQRAKIRPPTASLASQGVAIPGLVDVGAALPDAPEDAPPIAGGNSTFGLPSSTASAFLNATPPQAQPAAPPKLISPQLVRDPRLRSLLVMDLATFERVVEAKDYRLAVVMLASMLEAVVLDHAITRRAEFGLTGTPDTWNVQDLLVRAMGDGFAPKDLAIAYHLFSARNLLRPALQFVKPVVVTAATFEKHQEFVQRAVHRMGMPVAVPVQPADLPSPTRPAGE